MYKIGDRLELHNGVIVTVLSVDEHDKQSSYNCQGIQPRTGRLITGWVPNDTIIGIARRARRIRRDNLNLN